MERDFVLGAWLGKVIRGGEWVCGGICDTEEKIKEEGAFTSVRI